MYFRKIEKGFYDLKGDGNPKIVTDLMTRVKVREKVINEMSLYDKYDVPSGEDLKTQHLNTLVQQNIIG